MAPLTVTLVLALVALLLEGTEAEREADGTELEDDDEEGTVPIDAWASGLLAGAEGEDDGG